MDSSEYRAEKNALYHEAKLQDLRIHLFAHPTNPNVYPVTADFETRCAELFAKEGTLSIDIPLSLLLRFLRDYIIAYEHGEADSEELISPNPDSVISNVLFDFLLYLINNDD